MLKLNYIDRIETKLHKIEIEEKLRKIVLEDHFFNISTAGKKLCRLEYKENIYSFFLLSIGKHDMLSPRVYMVILEKKKAVFVIYIMVKPGNVGAYLYVGTYFGACA